VRPNRIEGLGAVDDAGEVALGGGPVIGRAKLAWASAPP